ncbi:MAG: DUF5662 family protein [Rickettsiales bacterium]|jgi:hypothetical protein|nr:DUF5662 family protein [Rickettsiales bacterium]
MQQKVIYKPFTAHCDRVTGKNFYHDGNYNIRDPRFYALVQPLRKSLEERLNIPTEELAPIRVRIQNHIDTVFYLGKLYDPALDFSEHDMSKMYDEFEDIGYIDMERFQTSIIYLSRDGYYSPDLEWAQKACIKHHKITNPHHPEFYGGNIDLMPDIRIIEMTDDWHSMALEKMVRNPNIKTPDTLDYYKNKALPKYQFNIYQQSLIMDSIKLFAEKTDMKMIHKIWHKTK